MNWEHLRPIRKAAAVAGRNIFDASTERVRELVPYLPISFYFYDPFSLPLTESIVVGNTKTKVLVQDYTISLHTVG